MKQRSDELFDPRIADWLEDGPDTAPSHVLGTLDSALPSIPQRQSWRKFWRSPSMSIPKLAGLAVAAALVVVVALGATALLTGRSALFGGTPPSPSPALTASPQASPTVAPSTPAPTATPTAAPTTATQSVNPSSLAISTSDVGRALQAGTYTVADFAAPFTVTLPAAWKATELTPNSVGLANSGNGSVNVYMAVMSKVYADPCHTAGGPTVVGPGVDDLVTALSSMPGFHVTDVTDATVGGATGKKFTITNSIDVAAAGCSGDMLPLGTYDKAGEDTDIAMFGGETDTFWVLDAGGTRVFMAVTDNAVGPTQTVRDSLSFEGAAGN